jgi:hypothetical protein
MERRMKRHHWTEKDDIVALYFYKFGDLRRTSSLETVGERRGMTPQLSNVHYAR